VFEQEVAELGVGPGPTPPPDQPGGRHDPSQP
jgi:hypothetical protein